MTKTLPAIGRPLRVGESVRITCGERTVMGVVTLASENGRSLIIGFDAMLHGHVGEMPVLQHDDGSFHSLIDGVRVEIEAMGGKLQ